jgi:hypothetical protein
MIRWPWQITSAGTGFTGKGVLHLRFEAVLEILHGIAPGGIQRERAENRVTHNLFLVSLG